jgi:ketosteroid isomerase-like protein
MHVRSISGLVLLAVIVANGSGIRISPGSAENEIAGNSFEQIASHSPGADSAAVMETLERFLRSFEHPEWESFRGHFHDEATVFQPLPISPTRNDGRAALEAVFSEFFEAVRRGSTGPRYLRIQPLNLRIQMMGDAAIATFHLETPDPSLLGRRTLVLRREGDRWPIMHLHASLATRQ